MAKFVFTGDPRQPGKDPKTCLSYGLTFVLNGDAVEAPNDDIAAKLRRHSHFTEETGDAPKEPERDKYDGMLIADLRAAAEAKNIEHAGMSKAELREALRAADQS